MYSRLRFADVAGDMYYRMCHNGELPYEREAKFYDLYYDILLTTGFPPHIHPNCFMSIRFNQSNCGYNFFHCHSTAIEFPTGCFWNKKSSRKYFIATFVKNLFPILANVKEANVC